MSDAAAKAAETADTAPAVRRPGGLLLGLRASAIALAVVLAAVLLGRSLQGEGGFDPESLMTLARNTPWAPFLTLGIFVVLGQTGFPQFVMIAAAVVVFGPLWGFALSWAGTMMSSSVGFVLGHLFGGELLRRFGGTRLNGVSERLGRHGIASVILLRNVPAGPFVAVNMMAGLSHISYRKFLIGTAVGIVPKMAFIALFGASFSKLLQEGSIAAVALVAAAAAAWIGAMFWMRRKARAWTQPGETREASAPARADQTKSPQA
ncbi:MAG: TVP38/TMEM64 family protein [Alphaproteobacteria bacterium]